MGSFTKHKLCPICWWDAVLLLSLKWLVLSTLGDGTPGDGEPFPLLLTRWEPDRWCYEAGPNEDYTLSTGSVFILLGRSWASAGARAPTPPPPWHSTRLGCGNSSCPRVQTEFLRVLTRTKIKGGWEDRLEIFLPQAHCGAIRVNSFVEGHCGGRTPSSGAASRMEDGTFPSLMMHRVNKAIFLFLWDIQSTFTDDEDEVHIQGCTPRFKYLNLYFRVEDN